MSIVMQAPLLLLALFLAALAAAAVEDGMRRRVSNLAVLVVAGSGIAAAIMTGHGLRLWEPLIGVVAVFGAGTFLFSRGLMGGGDVKLMAAGCFWYTLLGQLTYLAAALLAGGALAVIVILARVVRGKRALKDSTGIPYAIAIATGAAWTVVTTRFL